MFDPYFHATTYDLNAPASSLITITPSDTEDLAIGVKALRLFNPTGAAASVTVETVAGDTITFTIPAGLTIEPVRVTKVLVTGTTNGLEIIGYTDAPHGSGFA